MASEGPLVRRRRWHGSGSYVALGLLLLGAYGGCFPDFDTLSAGDDETGGTSGSGGTAGSDGGTSGTGDTGGTSGSGGGGTGGSGNTTSGGTSGTAGMG